MSIFDDFAGRDGGTYRPNPTNSQFEAQLAAFIEQQTKLVLTSQARRFQKIRPPIEFGVIANTNFNAVAAIEQGAERDWRLSRSDFGAPSTFPEYAVTPTHTNKHRKCFFGGVPKQRVRFCTNNCR
jgi:hypothetical protein